LKPLDRVLIEKKISNSSPTVQTIYEIIKSNAVDHDGKYFIISHAHRSEWMYELEAKKENQRYAELSRAFSIFENFEQLSLHEVEEAFEKSYHVLSEYLEKFPADEAIKNLLWIMDNIRENSQKTNISMAMSSYCTTIGLQINANFTQNAHVNPHSKQLDF